MIIERYPDDNSGIETMLKEGAVHVGTIIFDTHSSMTKAMYRKYILSLSDADLLVFKLRYNGMVSVEPLSCDEYHHYNNLGYIK